MSQTFFTEHVNKLTISPHASGYGLLAGKMNWQVYEAIREMPGQKRWVERDKLKFELTRRNLSFLTEALKDRELVLHPDVESRLKEIELKAQELENIRQLKHLPAEAQSWPWKTQPFDHQRKAFFLSRDAKSFALFMEMGTGKSKVAIDTAAYLYSQGEITALLIIAPNGVHRQWVTEQLPQHMPDWVPWKAEYKGLSNQKQLRADLAKAKDFVGLKIYSMNIEAFSSDRWIARCLSFIKDERVLMIVDESIRIKSPGALRTKACIKLGQFATYRRILSGAPVTKGVEDLYSQLRFLDPDVLGFNSYWSFRNYFCKMGGYENKQIVGYRHTDELLRQLDGCSFRVTKAECLDLPEKVYVRREVELTPDVAKVYKQLRDELWAQLTSGQVVEAPRAITLLLRLQQVLCGYIAPETGAKPVRLCEHNPRIQAALEAVQEAAGKTLLWARFLEDIDWLAEALAAAKVSYVVHDGRTKPEDRAKAIQAFQEDPDCRVFLGTPASGGIGLNLTAASTVVYYSNDFNADTRWQSEDRCHRIGQKNQVTYVDLVTPGTIDVKILGALRRKKSVADLVTGDSLRSLLDGRDEL